MTPSRPIDSGAALGPSSDNPRLSARALGAGCTIGVLLTVSNIYSGLKTGWWDNGAITAVVLGFALSPARARSDTMRSAMIESNLMQTMASSMGAMPAAAGMLGALPALALLGQDISFGSMAAWSLVLGGLGVSLGWLLRRRLLVEEKLPFPTGLATAEVITTIHTSGATGQSRAGGLLSVGAGAMALTWLRDAAGWIPAMTPLPGRLAGVPLAALTVGIGWSPTMFGAGVMVGPHVATSVLLGALLSWALLAPALLRQGLVAEARYGALVSWLIWPGMGILLGDALVSLARQAGAFKAVLRDLQALISRSQGGRDPGELRREPIPLAPVALGLGLIPLVLLFSWRIFALQPLYTALVLVLTWFLVSVCLRAAGVTDIAPLGQIGQLTQGALGMVTPHHPQLNIAAGAIPSGAASQAVTMLWSSRTGLELGTPPRMLVYAQVLGVLAGAAVSIPSYLLITRAYGIGSAALPAPTAYEWKAVASVMAGGLAVMPRHASPAAALGVALGALLALFSEGRLRRFVPSAMALGMGFIIPGYYACAMWLGSLLCPLARALRSRPIGATVPAGAIAGESLMGVIIALLHATGLIKPTL